MAVFSATTLVDQVKAKLAENSKAAFAFCFLVAVGVSKTLLTKFIFVHSPTPVAFSLLSCVATNLCLVPVLVHQRSMRMLRRDEALKFSGICLAIAIDLACQNVALAILSVALQQTLKATLPTMTVLVESAVRKKRFHPAIYLTVVAMCIGPVLVASGSSWDAKSAAGSQLFGSGMMLIAMLGGAFKYVLCHAAIKEFQAELGVLGFTFWVEVVVALLLAPWALLNGELARMFAEERSAGGWALLLFAGAFGGVRVVSQFLFLARTSATSLAASSLVMQALTILLGIFFFSTRVTALLALGVLTTILVSALYTYLKLSTILQPDKAGEPVTLATLLTMCLTCTRRHDADERALSTTRLAAEASQDAHQDPEASGASTAPSEADKEQGERDKDDDGL